MSAVLDAAHAYLARGWQPVQLHGLRGDGKTCTCGKKEQGKDCGRSTAKHPVDTGWQSAPAPTGADIAAMYARRPWAHNVGILTGRPSGLLVLDVDPEAGGAVSLAELVAANGELPATYTVRTGSGGRHYYFTMPDFPVGNSAGRLGPGLDTRGDGGQVVAPPSRSVKGPYSVEVDAPVAEAPGWLLDRLRPAERPAAPEPAAAAAPSSRYVATAVRYELERLDRMTADATPGGHGYTGEPWNPTTFAVACNLIELANARAGYTVDRARADLLRHAPTDAGFGPDEHEARWESAAAKVGGNARAVPADTKAQVGTVSTMVPTGETPPPALQFQTYAEMCAEIDAAPPRSWLLRGWWPAGDYGVHGAGWKAQKTWNACDLAVSVASGTDWLGAVPVDNPGPVLTFLGEGGKANYVRRIRAVCESRGLKMEDLPGAVCARAPHLADAGHLALMAAQIGATRPRLVVVDPFYLAAGGADGRDLYAMGALLERPQHLCAGVGAALLVVTHFNRSRDGRGSARITGAGPAEWGRVLITAETVASSTDETTKESTVTTDLDAIGGEIPEQGIRIRRRIVAEDPDDLGSPLRYAVEVLPRDSPAAAATTGGQLDLAPAAQKLLDALRRCGGPTPSRRLVDLVAEEHGHGLKRETVSRSLNDLLKAGRIDRLESPGNPTLWSLLADGGNGQSGEGVTGSEGVTSHVTSHVRGGVTGCDRRLIGGHTHHTSDLHVCENRPEGEITPSGPPDSTAAVTPPPRPADPPPGAAAACGDCGWPLDSLGHLRNCGDLSDVAS